MFCGNNIIVIHVDVPAFIYIIICSAVCIDIGWTVVRAFRY
jgi:hypothetical protein